jgi:hypothetical protein
VTDRARGLQVDLVPTSDALAGPLYSILTKGNCENVFEHDEKRFPGVTTVEDFRSWALLAEEYKISVEGFEASAPVEIEDCTNLL